MKTAGIILCGGRSRRMGSPKALLPFGRELMLPRVARILGSTVDSLLVVAAADQQLPSLSPAVGVLRDRVPDQGPLEGLRVGLDALTGDVDAAFVSGCDTPLLLPEFVMRLFAMLESYQVAVPCDGPFFHPLAAAYRPVIVPVIDQLLQDGKRRPADLFERVRTRHVDINMLRDVDPELRSLMNVNRPDEYAEILRHAGLADDDGG